MTITDTGDPLPEPGNVVTIDGEHIETVKLDPATEIERLAGLNSLAYESERMTIAKALGFRLSRLDNLVSNARKENGSDDDTNDLGLFNPKPWTDKVAGAELLDGIVDDLRRYVVIQQQAAEVVALWTVHTHCFGCFQKTPRLHVTAPEKGCGKSTLLDVLGCLALKAIKTENLSTAVFFRVVDKHGPTLLIDEVDTFLRDNEELRGALNAGHAKGGLHFRCEGDNNDVRGFKTFAPAALAGIGKIPPTLADRSVQVILQKRLADEPMQDFRKDRAQHLKDRASQIARWVRDHVVELRAAEPELPAGVLNRLADNWRPLVAIADAAGDDWPDRARNALTQLRDDDEGDSTSVMVLADMWGVFEEKNADRLPTAEILIALNAMEDRPWSEWRRGKELSGAGLSSLLKKFKTDKNNRIRSKQVRFADKTLKGYEKADLVEFHRRYVNGLNAVTPSFLPETPQQTNEIKNLGENQSETPALNVSDNTPPNPLKDNDCFGVSIVKAGGGSRTHSAGETDLDIPKFMKRCEHCGLARTSGNPVLEVHDGDRSGFVHRECQADWLAKITDTGPK